MHFLFTEVRILALKFTFSYSYFGISKYLLYCRVSTVQSNRKLYSKSIFDCLLQLHMHFIKHFYKVEKLFDIFFSIYVCMAKGFVSLTDLNRTDERSCGCAQSKHEHGNWANTRKDMQYISTFFCS